MDIPNLKYIDDLAGDDAIFRKQFITIIKEEFPQERLIYLDLIAKNQFKDTADIVHKLKHKFNILGMENSYRIAVEYEKQLLKGEKDNEAEFKAILSTIEKYIITI